MGQNMAKATNFTDVLQMEIDTLVAKSRERERPTFQCTVPIEMIVWMQAVYIRSRRASVSISGNATYEVRLPKSVLSFI